MTKVLLEEGGRWSNEMADVLEGRIRRDDYPLPNPEPDTPQLPPNSRPGPTPTKPQAEQNGGTVLKPATNPTPLVPGIILTPPAENSKENSNDPNKQTFRTNKSSDLVMRPGLHDPEVTNVRKAFGSLLLGSKKSEPSSHPETSDPKPQTKDPQPGEEDSMAVKFEFEQVIPDSVGGLPPVKTLTKDELLTLDTQIKRIFKSLESQESPLVNKDRFFELLKGDEQIKQYLTHYIVPSSPNSTQVTLNHILDMCKSMAGEQFSYTELYKGFLEAQGEAAPSQLQESIKKSASGNLAVPKPSDEVIFEIERSESSSVAPVSTNMPNQYKPLSQRDFFLASVRSLLNSEDAVPKGRMSGVKAGDHLGSQKALVGNAPGIGSLYLNSLCSNRSKLSVLWQDQCRCGPNLLSTHSREMHGHISTKGPTL